MIARQLYQLQELDLELDERKRALSQLLGQLGESGAIIRLRAELASEQKRLDEIRQQIKSLEWEIDDFSEKIKSAEEKLYGGKVRNPKELEALQQESGVFKARCSRLEDTALDLMGQADTISASLKTRSGELKRLETEWDARQQELSGEIERTREAIAELERKRQELSASISPDALPCYQSLMEQKGTAVARVEQGRCSGCRILLATTELQRARNRLVQCSSCGRILFVS